MRSAHHMDKPLTATAGAGCGAYHGTRLQCRQGSSGGGPVVVLLPAGRGRGETRRVAFACVQREPRRRRCGVPVRAAPAPCLVRAWSQRRPPRYRRRSTGGIRESDLDRLRAAAGEAGGTADVDSTVNRARRHAAGSAPPSGRRRLGGAFETLAPPHGRRGRPLAPLVGARPCGRLRGLCGRPRRFRGYADEIWKDGTPLCAGTAGIT